MLRFTLSVHAFLLLAGFTQLIVSRSHLVWPKPGSAFLSQNMLRLLAPKFLLITLFFFQLLMDETSDSTWALLAQCISQGSPQKQNREDIYMCIEKEREEGREIRYEELWRLASPKIHGVSLLETQKSWLLSSGPNISRLKMWEESLCQFESKSRIKADTPFKIIRQEEFPLSYERVSFFVLLRPSANLVRPTHIMAGSLLYSVLAHKLAPVTERAGRNQRKSQTIPGW